MVKRVAKEMGKWRLKSFENIAVHLRGFTDDFKTNLFAEVPGDVPDHPREMADAVTKWTHARSQRFQIQPVSQLHAASVEHIQFEKTVG